MKIAKQFLICVLLLFAAQNGLAAKPVLSDTNETGPNETDLTEKSGQTAELQDAEAVQKINANIYQAWQQFCLAKNSEAADVRSEAYANAIKYISEAYAMNAERPDTMLSASRIYRSMGGLSYAKNYFSQAAAIYLDEAMQKPESIQANLNAAIILYAGDVRYWASYEESKKNAWGYADKVLELCKKKKSEKKTDAEDRLLEEATAVAFLIKENVAGSNTHFAKAEKLWNKENVKMNPELIKIIEPEEHISSEFNDVYQPYALFKEYPQQGKWFWPVTKQTEASKEFLLNCLTGFYVDDNSSYNNGSSASNTASGR